MFQKINLKQIIIDHWRTLYSSKDREKIDIWDVILFYVVPIIISCVLIVFCSDIFQNVSSLNIVATIVSIFAGLLLNLLLLIFDILQKMKEGTPNRGLKRKFLKEINANISYCVLISIIIIVLLLLNSLDFLSPIIHAIDFLLTFFVIHFILILFMVLKRVYLLLEKEFEN